MLAVVFESLDGRVIFVLGWGCCSHSDGPIIKMGKVERG